MTTRQQLLKIPRYERARVQGLKGRFTIGIHSIIRTSRYYWTVSGTPMKLNKAIETIGEVEAAPASASAASEVISDSQRDGG
jgi:hypothetical protein